MGDDDNVTDYPTIIDQSPQFRSLLGDQQVLVAAMVDSHDLPADLAFRFFAFLPQRWSRAIGIIVPRY